MPSRNQHPRQKAAFDAALEAQQAEQVLIDAVSNDREKIGTLFQLYKEFGHDMSVQERTSLRQTIYDILETGLTAGYAIKGDDIPSVGPSMIYAEDVGSDG